MAVTVTDRRTTVTSAENTTGWTGAGFGTTTTSAEGTNAVAGSLAATTGQTYFTGTGVNLGTSPGTLVYVWAFNNALQDAWDASPPPNALLLGDGTDRIGFDMAGADRRVFNHLEGPTGLDVNGWQCLVLDTAEASNMNTAGNTYLVSGTFAGLNFASITDWGASFDTNSKALGGGYNVAVDIIRYGNDGIRITAGGAGTEGIFSEITTEDSSRTTAKAHGILRELNPITFSCQGPMTFGDSGAATDSRFIDTGIILAYENRNIADDKYYFNVEGHISATNVFELRGSTITTGGPNVAVDMSGGNINTIVLDGCTFLNLGGLILFSAAADATGHSVTACTFDGCDRVDPGDVTFERNTFQNSTALAGESAAVLLDADGTANWLDLIFNGVTPGGGHGIEITGGTSHNFVGHKFSGFGPALIEFDASSGTVVNTALDQLDLPADHGYSTEDPIYYQDQGGTGIGLTDGDLYYVRAVDSNSISFHQSDTDAAADTNRQALNTGTGTQEIASADAAIWNNSGGSITINVSGGGDSPSVRNSDGSDTTVNATVDLSLRMVDEEGVAVTGAEITVTDTSATPVELFHVESSVTGTEVYQFDQADATNAVVILVMKTGNTDPRIPFQLDTTLPAVDTALDLVLRTDRVEFNPP